MANDKKFYAHSLQGRPREEWQSLEEHLMNVAGMAKKFSEPFKAGEWAYLAGLFHDIGKYSHEFQEMLIKSSDNDINMESKVGHPDHSTAGAKEINGLLDKGLGRLLAYVIAGHHTGLLDGKSNESCLERRLKKNISDYSVYHREIDKFYIPIKRLPLNLDKDRVRLAFQLSFFVRMIFSTLVDADFLDTENFMNKKTSLLRSSAINLTDMQNKLTEALDKVSLKAEATIVNRFRKSVLQQCLSAAENTPGLFSLTVPTGGGKTLSSLSFALKHAITYGMQRVIYVIPYTSIIEQNADVFRKIFGKEAVLEHHCNFDLSDDYKAQLASENWDAPVIVTTNVQFFESLFHNRTLHCRRIHNISNSVIILDEAQMLPVPLLKPCMEVLRELTIFYKSTIVLCSATQPALSKTEEFKNGLEGVREIVPNPEKLYTEFKRVEIKLLSSDLDKILDSELADKISEHPQVLCVVNTRKHARMLYQKIKEREGLYHLSALMCPAHRSKVINQIKQSLKSNKKCRVISTQLIEAGVDIDFPVVFRSASGIDSIIQSAGRCNREGKLPFPGKVYVFYPENVLPVGYLRQSAEVAASVIRKHPDLSSLEAVKEYFRQLYWRNGDNLDKHNILGRLSEEVGQVNLPFKEIAGKFKIIDNGMESIIIPFEDEARGIIKQLRFAGESKHLLRKIQRFCVQVYPNMIIRLLSSGAVEFLNNRIYILNNEHLYKDDIGLDDENPYFREIEKDII